MARLTAFEDKPAHHRARNRSKMLSRNLLVWIVVVTTITGETSAIKVVPLLGTWLQHLQMRLPSTKETWTHWREVKEGPQGWWQDQSISHTRKGWELGLFNLEKRDLVNGYKYLKGRCKEDGPRCPVTGQEAMDTNWNTGRSSCLKIRKYFFTVRVTEPWHWLTTEVVESPSLEIVKKCLDTVLDNWL